MKKYVKSADVHSTKVKASSYDDLDSCWEELESKQVQDSDGFYTDYTLYHNTETDQYVCVFGDKDIYRPGDTYYDFECDTYEEAIEWFESYEGFADEVD